MKKKALFAIKKALFLNKKGLLAEKKGLFPEKKPLSWRRRDFLPKRGFFSTRGRVILAKGRQTHMNLSPTTTHSYIAQHLGEFLFSG